jgi:hypothetical protein
MERYSAFSTEVVWLQLYFLVPLHQRVPDLFRLATDFKNFTYFLAIFFSSGNFTSAVLERSSTTFLGT